MEKPSENIDVRHPLTGSSSFPRGTTAMAAQKQQRRPLLRLKNMGWLADGGLKVNIKISSIVFGIFPSNGKSLVFLLEGRNSLREGRSRKQEEVDVISSESPSEFTFSTRPESFQGSPILVLGYTREEPTTCDFLFHFSSAENPQRISRVSCHIIGLSLHPPTQEFLGLWHLHSIVL